MGLKSTFFAWYLSQFPDCALRVWHPLMSIVQLVRQKSQKQDYLQFSLFLFQSQRIPATIMGENQQNRKENQSNPPGLDRKIRDRSQSYVRQGGQSIANLWSPFLFGQSKYQSIKYFIFKHLLVVRCHLVKWVINIFMDGIVNIVWAAAHFCTWGEIPIYCSELPSQNKGPLLFYRPIWLRAFIELHIQKGVVLNSQ